MHVKKGDKFNDSTPVCQIRIKEKGFLLPNECMQEFTLLVHGELSVKTEPEGPLIFGSLAYPPLVIGRASFAKTFLNGNMP